MDRRRTSRCHWSKALRRYSNDFSQLEIELEHDPEK
jgi:hypothetical protein